MRQSPHPYELRRPLLLLVGILAVTQVLADESGKFSQQRKQLVKEHIQGNGVANDRVIESLTSTPRHEFVPLDVRGAAYRDLALPIGYGQTISSPYIVARMTEQLNPQPNDRVLEVGTGSGYQAAILSPLVKQVFSIEIVPELGLRAKKTLDRLGYQNVTVRVGDGYQGWPEKAPFNKIIVTCSPGDIPQPLVDQLAEGGHLVIPVGERFQQILYRFTKNNGKLKKQHIESTFFVPMTGLAESQRGKQPHGTRLINGGFEDRNVDGSPFGWYYVRGGEIVEDAKSPQGVRCLRIQKLRTERAHALQPIGVDPAKSASLKVGFRSKGEAIKTSLLALDNAQLIIEFYDKDRSVCGDSVLEVPSGSFPWRSNEIDVDIPAEAHLAMIELGLFGASGTIFFDDVTIKATPKVRQTPN